MQRKGKQKQNMTATPSQRAIVSERKSDNYDATQNKVSAISKVQQALVNFFPMQLCYI